MKTENKRENISISIAALIKLEENLKDNKITENELGQIDGGFADLAGFDENILDSIVVLNQYKCSNV